MKKQYSLFCSIIHRFHYASFLRHSRVFSVALLAIFLMAIGPVHAGQGKEGRYTTDVWTPELVALDKASTAARNYAETNNGVGILIHLGSDVPNQRVANGDELGQLFVDRFAELGASARYFVRPNDARASGITYHIGHLLFGPGEDKVHDLQTAWDSAPQVIEQLRIVKSLQEFKETD